MANKYSGVIVANTTPFRKDGTLDREALCSEVEYLIGANVNGFFAGGTYGEGPMMLPGEYDEYIHTFAAAVKQRVPIIAQVGAVTLDQVVTQAKSAASAGVDAIAAVPPFYYPHDDTALIGFYSDLCQAVSMPVFIYNNPGRSGNKISAGLFARLCKIPGISGMKDSGDNLGEFCRFSMAVAEREDFSLLMGSDDMMLAGLVMGAPGAISVLSALFPEIYVNMWEAFVKGDLETARKLQYEAIRVRMVLKRGPYISTYKAILNALGRGGGYSKKPVRTPSEEELTSIYAGLRNLGYLE